MIHGYLKNPVLFGKNAFHLIFIIIPFPLNRIKRDSQIKQLINLRGSEFIEPFPETFSQCIVGDMVPFQDIGEIDTMAEFCEQARNFRLRTLFHNLSQRNPQLRNRQMSGGRNSVRSGIEGVCSNALMSR